MATGVQYCITPCYNSYVQIHNLSGHFGGGFHVNNLRTFLALLLGILGEKERADLCDELRDVWLPGTPGNPDPFAVA